MELLDVHKSNVQVTDNNGRNCLLTAIFCGHFDLVELFISKYKLNPGKVDKKGWNALMIACRHSHFPLVEYFIQAHKMDPRE